MDLEALALTVDELVRFPAAERGPGRLYAVRCTGATVRAPADEGNPSIGAAGVVLEVLAEGEARTLPHKVRPPAGVRAIALASSVWVAPLEDDGTCRLRPSRHPERRRAHVTVLVGSDGGRDGVDVTVLRDGDGAPEVLRGGTGLLHHHLLRCWSRRPGAPWAAEGGR